MLDLKRRPEEVEINFAVVTEGAISIYQGATPQEQYLRMYSTYYTNIHPLRLRPHTVTDLLLFLHSVQYSQQVRLIRDDTRPGRSMPRADFPRGDRA
jgi:hypothetical protein